MFRFIRCISTSPTSEVWEAEGPNASQFAMKVTRLSSSDQATNLLNVLSLVRGLEHPALLHLQAYWRDDNKLSLAMELAEASLFDRASEFSGRGCPFPIADLIAYTTKVASALDYYRKHDLVHGAVEPRHIVLVDGRAKLGGYTQTRKLSARKPATYLSTSSLAPEIREGNLSAHTDQFGLATTYALLRTGLHLASAMSSESQLTSLPREEQRIVLKALAADPEDRFSSCVEFALSLEEATAHSG